ncbi:isocitrate lyase/PEP mutase family protein [Dactylosporangium sp. CA-092794]|uniref:isocitrate lyase/PEP mutase family protein n=1 Tax=Dactylosporangium sp. CA-092794 TaxID=3239929 RepID=UPI003D90770F
MTLSTAEQAQRAAAFRDLHTGPTFVTPNPWDAGTAKLLTAAGFPALATTSAGLAFSLGRPDGAGLVSREETLANVAAIAAATSLPVAADLESGFGATPEDVAETIRLAAAAGAVGGSIEDSTGDPAVPIRPVDEAVRRIQAAARAARELPWHFTLTARAENFLHGIADLDDTVARLHAYQEAGADVVFAPGLPSLAAVRTVCAAVKVPVSFMAGFQAELTVAALSEAGVRRISVGPTLTLAALSATFRAAQELHEHGTFEFTRGVLGYGEISRLCT